MDRSIPIAHDSAHCRGHDKVRSTEVAQDHGIRSIAAPGAEIEENKVLAAADGEDAVVCRGGGYAATVLGS